MNYLRKNNQESPISETFFPFYKSSHHQFLLKKWWFRALIVFYALSLILIALIVWVDASSFWDLIGPLVFHYIVQFFFFNIIINFIVLGSKASVANDGKE